MVRVEEILLRRGVIKPKPPTRNLRAYRYYKYSRAWFIARQFLLSLRPYKSWQNPRENFPDPVDSIQDGFD